MFGGVQAVTWTDVKQMFLIVFGLLAAIIVLVVSLPPNVGVSDALTIAGTTGRLQTFDFRFDLTDRWTFWSGTIASLFLFLSYFGTDQSQVQRYLTARSVDEARVSLFMSAYWKIPLQVLVLLIGVMMFVFYIFTPPPMLFNPVHDRAVPESARAAEYQALEATFGTAIEQRRAGGLAVGRRRIARTMPRLKRLRPPASSRGTTQVRNHPPQCRGAGQETSAAMPITTTSTSCSPRG